MLEKNLSALTLGPSEHMVLKFRKHWFVLLQKSLGTAVSVILVPLILASIAYSGLDLSTLLPPSLTTFLTLWWLLVVWLALAIIWTNYYLDLWLVTDKRLISVDQTGLFYREVTTLPFANVQDVTIEQRGILQTLLNFGTLTVQTAGPTTNNMIIRGVARPNVVRDKIIAQCELLKKAQTAPPASVPHPAL